MRSAAVGKNLTIGLALALLVLLVFQDVRHHEFVNYDDEVYVTENSSVRRGLTLESISWAFGSRVSRHWHPLTWLSHMLDVELYGLNAAGHHLTNLLLHTVNTVLLFIVLARMTGSVWGGAFVAALFALHPLHVEPVAWISDRKDLLAGFFWILTMGLYFLWTKHRSPVRYAALLAAFACGLMSKAVLVSLPVVLLLLDYWPLGRLSFAVSAQGGGLRALADRMGSALRALGPRVREKVPLLVLSGVSAIVAIFVMEQPMPPGRGGQDPTGLLSLDAPFHYVAYLGKMVWPGGLAVRYPRVEGTDWGPALLLLLALGALTLWALRTGRRYPWFPVGWLWFLVTLLPTLGLFRAGPHRIADRYTYLPSVGLFIVVTWGIPRLLSRWRHHRAALLLAGCTVLALLGWRSSVEVGHWQNSVSLLKHSLEVNPRSARVHSNLGTAYLGRGDLQKALAHYREALRMEPRNPLYLYNLGYVFVRQQEWDRALKALGHALKIRPRFPEALNGRGLCRVALGFPREGVSDFLKALELKPDYSEARQNLGRAFLLMGRPRRAVEELQRALALDPKNPAILVALGRAQVVSGLVDAAVSSYEKAHRLLPVDSRVCNELASLYARKGRLDDAVRMRKRALALDPEDGAAHYRLAVEQYFRGEYEEAVRHCDRAVSLNYRGVEPEFMKRLERFRK